MATVLLLPDRGRRGINLRTDNVPIPLPQIGSPSSSRSHSPTNSQTNENNTLKSDAERIVEDNDIWLLFRIKRFPCVVCSIIGEQGAVCKYCAIFGRAFDGKGSHRKLITLVIKPFNNWKKAIEKFNEYSRTEFRKSNAMRANNFIAVYSENCQNIIQKLDSGRAIQIEQNRKRFYFLLFKLLFFVGVKK
ncbi:Hypothetical protein CINCED_3A013375 [Cinara cedri]|uniref:Uncharacterized protein n=1 Tax=Cinara cedri TaxID=506608 RepID=A0A5E4NN53_9HEMI|nr:Hypothetical protein CINCED_3A013375 [Cinara cedri]